MIKKISLILLFLLTFHLTIGLKSTDFCIPNDQKECKGYYDRHKQYQMKCNTIKCHGTLSYECGSDICSNNMIDCIKYDEIKLISNKPFRTRTMMSTTSIKQLKEKNDFDLLNRQIKKCKYKLYKFKSTDFCLNGRICRIILRYRHQKVIEKIDCQCPKEQSFKCDKFCTSDSLACDYFKSNENKQYFQNITQCNHHDFSTLKTNYMFW